MRRASIGGLAAALIVSATQVAAQMPGAPLLQNAWASPGIVGAVNFGSGSGASVYGLAAAWASPTGRFQLSGGAGLRSGTAGTGSKSVYGVRAAIPFGGASSDVGFGAFVGAGGGARNSASSADSTASTTFIPVGLALGWRHAMGAARGFSVYATPSYFFASGGSNNGGLVRTALGVDVGITKTLGATAGVEFGQNRTRSQGGPSGTLFGLGISYAGGRR